MMPGMAAAKIKAYDRFPAGTVIGAYPVVDMREKAAPASAAITTATMNADGVSGGILTAATLVQGTTYVAYALVGGEHRYMRFVAGGDLTIKQRELRNVDRDNGQAGMYAPSAPGWTGAGLGLTANTAIWARVVPSRDMTITQLAFAVSTAAGSDDACDVGIYDANLQRIVSSGATAGKLNSVGVKTVAFAATTLKAGTVYYVAISCGAVGTTAATIRGASWAATEATQLFGTGVGVAEAFLKAASHPLPAGPVAAPTATSLAPAMAVRES